MTVTSTGTLSSVPPITTSLATSFIPTPTPASIAASQAMRMIMDPKEGTTKRCLQIPLLPIFPSAVPINSSGPSPISPTYYSRDIVLSMYAQCTILDIRSELTSQIAWMEKVIQSQEVATVRTEDFVMAEMLSSSANTIYAVGGTNGDSPTNWSIIDSNNATGSLINANAPYTTSTIRGEDRFGTIPQAPGFLMMTSTVAVSTFLNDSEFTQPKGYPDPNLALPNEVGAYGTLRMMCSSDWPIYSSGLSLNGNPIVQGAITSVQSYVLVMHSALYRRITMVGAAFYGSNLLQQGTSAQNYFGTGIVQPLWVYNALYTI